MQVLILKVYKEIWHWGGWGCFGSCLGGEAFLLGRGEGGQMVSRTLHFTWTWGKGSGYAPVHFCFESAALSLAIWLQHVRQLVWEDNQNRQDKQRQMIDARSYNWLAKPDRSILVQFKSICTVVSKRINVPATICKYDKKICHTIHTLETVTKGRLLCV